MAEDIIDKILSIMFWIFLVISIVLILWRVFGSSPLLDQIVAALATGLFFEFLRLERTVARHSEQIKNLDQKVEKGFNELRTLIMERK